MAYKLYYQEREGKQLHTGKDNFPLALSTLDAELVNAGSLEIGTDPGFHLDARSRSWLMQPKREMEPSFASRSRSRPCACTGVMDGMGSSSAVSPH